MKQLSIAVLFVLMLSACDRDHLVDAPAFGSPVVATSVLADTVIINGRTAVITERIVYDTTYLDEPTVFLGSSSTTPAFWKTLATNFQSYNPLVVAKGGWFLYNVDTAITNPYSRIPSSAKQVVEWCGENDIYDAKSRNVRLNIGDYMYRFKNIPKHLRSKLPNAKLTFIEIKKTPKLQPWWSFIDECNAEMKKLVLSMPNTSWVEINQYLNPATDYGTDGMHLKSTVYPRVIEPAVQRHLIY